MYALKFIKQMHSATLFFFLTVVKCISSLIPNLDLDVVTIYGSQRRELGEPTFVPYRHCCRGISTSGTLIDGIDFYMDCPIENNAICWYSPCTNAPTAVPNHLSCTSNIIPDKITGSRCVQFHNGI